MQSSHKHASLLLPGYQEDNVVTCSDPRKSLSVGSRWRIHVAAGTLGAPLSDRSLQERRDADQLKAT